MFTHSKFNSILCLLILNDGSHLKVVLKCAGHMVRSLAGLDAKAGFAHLSDLAGGGERAANHVGNTPVTNNKE